eukprot:119765-Prymnesium_polylepis.1
MHTTDALGSVPSCLQHGHSAPFEGHHGRPARAPPGCDAIRAAPAAADRPDAHPPPPRRRATACCLVAR